MPATIQRLKKIYKESGYEALNKALDNMDSTSMSLEDVSTILGTVPSEIQRIEQAALRKLRHPKISRKLRAYMKEAVTPEQGLCHDD